MVIGVATALPCVLLPWLLEPRSEAAKPLARRFWIKANLWIAILSFIGNYLWTHYFYQVLGAEYTFPSWQLNQVPGRSCCSAGASGARAGSRPWRARRCPSRCT